MDKNIQFANRAGFNLKFYKYDSRRPEHGFKADEAPLVVDFVNSCTLETTGETTWATGGKGFKRLIGFNNPLEGTFTIETQITNPRVWAMVAGQNPQDFDPKRITFANKTGQRKFFYVVEADTTFVDEDGINYVQEVILHKASVNRAFSAQYTGDGDPQSISIVLDLAEDADESLVTLSFDESEVEPEPLPILVEGATTDFTLEQNDTLTLQVADFVNENDAPRVTYTLSKDNTNITLSTVENGQFTITGAAGGSSVVTLNAMRGGRTVLSINLKFTVNALLPTAVAGPMPTVAVFPGTSTTVTVVDFINENGAEGITYTLSTGIGGVVAAGIMPLNNAQGGVTVSSIVDGKFTIYGVTAGPVMVVLQAFQHGKLVLSVDIPVTVNPCKPMLVPDAPTQVAIYETRSHNIAVTDFINENNAQGVTYSLSKDNENVIVYSIVGGEFRVEAVGIGTSVVTIKAVQDNEVMATANITITIAPLAPSAVEGAWKEFEFYPGETETLLVSDYICENDAAGVTFKLSKNNKHVTITDIVNGEFIVEGVSKGTSVVTLKAIQGGQTKVSVEITFIVKQRVPAPVDGATLNFEMTEGETMTLTAADFIDENTATGVTYALSKDNAGVIVSSLVGGEFTVEAITPGVSTVILQALVGGVIKVQVDLAFTIKEAPPEPQPYAVDGAVVNFSNVVGDSQTFSVADFINENGVAGIEYSVSTNNNHVTVTDLIGGEFIAESVAEGVTVITLKALIDDVEIVTVKITITVYPDGSV